MTKPKSSSLARRALVAAACSLFACLAIAGPASAFNLSTDSTVPWPFTTITYHNQSKFPVSVDRAAAAWNRANVGYKLVKVDDADEANVNVYTFDRNADQCTGSTIHGYNFAQTFMVLNGGRCDSFIMTLAATHEFGHLFTMLHENDTCAVMNSRSLANSSRPRLARPTKCSLGTQYWRSPVRPDDRAGGRAARARPFSFPSATCYESDGSFQSQLTANEHLCNYQYDCRAVEGPAPLNPDSTIDDSTGKQRWLNGCEISRFDTSRVERSLKARGSIRGASAKPHAFGESPGTEVFGRSR